MPEPAQATQETRSRASHILLAIFIETKNHLGKRQLFVKAPTSKIQQLVATLVNANPFLKDYFVFSDSGPEPYCPGLTDAMQELFTSGMLCRPYLQEPDLLRFNPSAEKYYQDVLRGKGPDRLSLDERLAIRRVVPAIPKFWPHFVDRPRLEN